MKNFITLLVTGFLIWRINELANIVITINALTLILWGLFIAVVFYGAGFNALHLNLIKFYERFVDWFSPVDKHPS